MIRLGLYGCGKRTAALLDSLIQDNFYMVHAVFDLNRESAEKLAGKYGGTVCRSPEDLSGFQGIDAFLISLAPEAHAEALRKTIPAGKPVFVEKPVSFSAKEVLELAELAERFHVLVQVGFMRRYLPDAEAVLNYIAQNPPGRIYSVTGNWFHQGDMEINYWKRRDPDNFRLKISQIPFHCCHMLDLLLMFGGPASRVCSQMVRRDDRPYPSPDDLIAVIEYRNGGNGIFHYSSSSYFGEISYRLNAEHYSIRMSIGENQVEIFPRPRFLTSQLGSNPDPAGEFFDFNSSYLRFRQPRILKLPSGIEFANEQIMYDFIRMVRDGIPPSADLRTAVHVQGLAEAIESSARLGKSVALTPDGIPVIS